MADLTDYSENKLAAVLTDKPWIKLHVGHPGEAGTANPAAESTRKQVTLAAGMFGVRASTTEAVWAEVLTAETITHVSAWDAATGGNCEWVAALPSPKAVKAGGTLRAKAGALTFALA